MPITEFKIFVFHCSKCKVNQLTFTPEYLFSDFVGWKTINGCDELRCPECIKVEHKEIPKALLN